MINNISPNEFKNKHPGKSFLLIGCGNSASELIPYKKELSFFDVIIGANKSFVEFDSVMTYHLISEKITNANAEIFTKILNAGDFNRDLPRFINYKGLSFFDQNKYNIIPITRSNHNGNLDIKSYTSSVNGINSEGFFTGPVGSDKFSLGTVMLQALHMACMMGAKKVYTIGADLVFKNNFDHFYNDRIYRDKKIGKKENQHTIISVGGLETTRYFYESAGFLDNVIDNICRPLGIEVYDMSDGLIKKATKIRIGDVINGQF